MFTLLSWEFHKHRANLIDNQASINKRSENTQKKKQKKKKKNLTGVQVIKGYFLFLNNSSIG
jgi:hypothetical protein